MIETDISFIIIEVAMRVLIGYALEHSRRHRNHHQAIVLGTNLTNSTALVNHDFSGIN